MLSSHFGRAAGAVKAAGRHVPFNGSPVRYHSTRVTGTRPLRVLAVESSADDSCAAVVTSNREILANIVCKQHHVNEEFGGIHPIKAQENHQVDVPKAIAKALSMSRLKLEDIDAIAYTRGPGMMGCLSVGSTAAKTLAAVSGKPLIGVHHMQAHALTPLLTEEIPPGFPFLTLLVSGGHTQLVLAESMDKYSILSNSLDNAVGDAFDKAARLLKLPPSPTSGYGAMLEEYAAAPPLPPYDEYTSPFMRSFDVSIPVPLSKNHEKSTIAFSFAGLTSALERKVKLAHSRYKTEAPPLELQRALSRSFQESTVQHVIDKTRAALKKLKFPVHGLVVSGGVGSNQYLRKQLREMLEEETGGDVPLFHPPIELCTDNAAMIAWVAILRLQNGLVGEGSELPLRKKWSLEHLYNDVPDSAYRM